MRLALSLILTSVAVASVGSPFLSDSFAVIDQSSAGQSVRVSVRSAGERNIRMRTWIKDRNGAKRELPPVTGTSTPPQSKIEGPEIPPGEGGGTVIVEIFDADTGESLGTDGAPISY